MILRLGSQVVTAPEAATDLCAGNPMVKPSRNTPARHVPPFGKPDSLRQSPSRWFK
jgi:hypothetical protein